MKEQNLDELSSMPVSKAVLKNVIPAMVAMIMVLIYNLADTFFIGQTHNDLLVASVSLATPIFLIFMSVGSVFGIGGTSVISRALGQGKQDYAKKVSSFCMWSCVFIGILMSLLFLIFLDPIVKMLGASDEIFIHTKNYLSIIILSGPFILLSNCFSNTIRAEGQSNKAMMGMVIGNLLNIILDPIMILVFKWNIAGAAIATVIGNVVGTLYYFYYFKKGNSLLSIKFKDFYYKDKITTSVLSIGIPASLGSMLMSISSIILNSQMANYGDMALAGIGVAVKVTMITGMICIGLGQGVQPLLGYCVGAKNWKRFKKITVFSLVFAFVLGVVMTGLCYIFTENIIKVFLTDAQAFDFGVSFARILLSTSCLFGVFYVLINALQATGAAFSSLVVNLSRQGIIYIPALFILHAILGEIGLVWAQPVADILSLALVSILFIKTYKTMKSRDLA